MCLALLKIFCLSWLVLLIFMFGPDLWLDRTSAQVIAGNKIRIYLDYQSSFNDQNDVEFYKANVMEPAIDHLRNATYLKRPSTTPILVDRDCINDASEYINNNRAQRACMKGCNSTTTCSGVPISEKYLKACLASNGTTTSTDGAGVSNYDLIILVTADSCPSLATGAACAQEPVYDRPIMGAIAVCKGKWNPRFDIQMNINTIKHEIIHVMGFAPEKFAFYRDDNENPRTPRDAIGVPSMGFNSVGNFYIFPDTVGKITKRSRKSLTMSYTKDVWGLTLPNLVTEARKHFNCPSLDSVDLEDVDYKQNEINSHFDKLFVGNELMSANSDDGEGALSRLTLAFLKDMGWYSVDYTKADNYTYGKGLGCDFLLLGCYDYMTKRRASSQSLAPFCDDVQVGYKLKCDRERRFIQTCNLAQIPSLGARYGYFDSLKDLPSGHNTNQYAGNDADNEHCPTYVKQVFSPFTSDCTIIYNNFRNDSSTLLWKDYYANDSKCFDTTSTEWFKDGNTAVLYGAMCFKANCNSTTRTVQIFLDELELCRTTTTAAKQTFTLRNLTGTIQCPTYKDGCELPEIPKTGCSSTTLSGLLYTVALLLTAVS